MKNIKTTLKYSFVSLILIFLLLLLTSTLYYFDIIGSSLVNYLRLFIIFLVLFFTSYILGKNTEKNGYLAGLKFGLVDIIFFFLISLIAFRGDFQLRIILYDIILLAISVLGSMIGINKSKK